MLEGHFPQQGRKYVELSGWGTLAIIVAAVAANANLQLKPLLLSSYVNYLNVPITTAGYIVGAEATATAIATVVTVFGIGQLGLSRVLGIVFTLIVSGNLASTQVHNVSALVLCRVSAGIGHGGLQAVTAIMIASVARPERLAGQIGMAVGLVFTALMIVIPMAQSEVGISPLFWTIASLGVPAVALIRKLPRDIGFTSQVGTRETMPIRNVGLIILTLFAYECFYLSAGSFWPFAAELVRQSGANYSRAATWTALASVAATGGSLFAVIMGMKVGRVIPAATSILVAIGSQLALISSGHAFYLSVAAVASYMLCWGALYPYLIGFTSELDPSGRTNGICYSLGLIGFAIGPNLGSAIITVGRAHGQVNLLNVVWLSVLCLTLSGCIIVAMLVYGRRSRQLYKQLS